MDKKHQASVPITTFRNLINIFFFNLDILQQQTTKIKENLRDIEQFLTSLDSRDLLEIEDFRQFISTIKPELEKIAACLNNPSLDDLKTGTKAWPQLLPAGSQAFLPKKILIIEDDPLTSRLIKHYLKDLKVEIAAFSEAEGGLDYIKFNLPDLILLDLMLPGIDGFQFLNEVKKIKPDQKIPIIIMSSISGEKEILKALELGATDYITKPFSPRIVEAKIRHYLNLK
jgi:PleD family two-component response regulator